MSASTTAADTSTVLDELLAGRAQRRRACDAELSRLAAVTDGAAAVWRAVQDAVSDERLAADMRQALVGLSPEELPALAESVLAPWRDAAARLSRHTINIGVSGRARTGKSTLLQALCGLTEDEVPTGSGLPVTAVRSRIFASPGQGRASLFLHTERSFLDEVVRPIVEQLGLRMPTSVTGFADTSLELTPERSGESDRLTLQRLQEMQESVGSYARHLTGQELTVPLTELRPWIAYPKLAEGERSRHRPYLAVSSVRIDCPFPRSGTERLGLVDLPGLGELAPGAERRHVADIREDADVVVLVKRPVQGLAFWGEPDARALDLLQQAARPARVQDFVVLLVNAAQQDDDELLSALRGDVERQVNAGVDRYEVLTANAVDSVDVDTAVLDPVLDHLRRCLPVTEGLVTADARAGAERQERSLAGRLHEIRSAITTTSVQAPREELDDAVRELHRDLAEGLQAVVAELRRQARGDGEDTDFLEAVEGVHAEVQAWVRGGFGVAPEQWERQALRAMRVDAGPGGVVLERLNAARVDIATAYARLDGFFADRITTLHDQVAVVLRAHLGDRLVPPGPAREALQALRGSLLSAEEPAPVLASALEDLLALRLDYRAQLHPRVREEADVLTAEVDDPETGQRRSRIVVDVSEQGAAQLRKEVSHLAEQVAFRTKQALLREAVLPAKVLFAAAEHFEDVLVRGARSQREIARLAHSYRDDIWPRRFSEETTAGARVRAVSHAVESLLSLVHHNPERMS